MLNKLIGVKTSVRLGKKEYSGICLFKNSQVLMLLNFNEETAQFDGFTLLRNEDFESYFEWDKEDLKEIKHDNSKAQIGNIKLSDYKSFKSAIQNLNSTLIAVFSIDDLDSYYVGRVMKLKGNTLTLQLISEEAEWIESISLNLESIWYIGFGTAYENQLLNDAE